MNRVSDLEGKKPVEGISNFEDLKDIVDKNSALGKWMHEAWYRAPEFREELDNLLDQLTQCVNDRYRASLSNDMAYVAHGDLRIKKLKIEIKELFNGVKRQEIKEKYYD